MRSRPGARPHTARDWIELGNHLVGIPPESVPANVFMLQGGTAPSGSMEESAFPRGRIHVQTAWWRQFDLD